MSIKKIRSLFLALLVVCVFAIGIFTLTGCEAKCVEHDFETETFNERCEEPSLVVKTCKKCGYQEEIEGPAPGHSFGEWSVYTSATCKSTGEQRRSCHCGEIEIEEIPKTKHAIDSWVVTEQPSETKEGAARGTCTNHACGATVTVTLPVINEENYEIEVIDSESKNITLKNGEYTPKVFVSNFNFININNESYSISVKSTITSERLVIPATYNGYPVVKIHSFANQTNIKEVVIPENVRTIERDAFNGCTNLTSITLPSTVKTIGTYDSNASITSQEVDIYYNGSAETWCNINFYGSLKIKNLYFVNDSGEYGLLTEITIPETVSAIGKNQFYGIKSLEKVNLHNAVTSIGDYAFSGTGLKSFDMPDSVTAMGSWAFSGCTSLEEIKLSENIDAINGNTFSGCASLKSVLIPANVKTIGYAAFYNCAALSDVRFAAGTSISTLGAYAFENCPSITSIILPSTVNTISQGAIYYNCKKIYYMGNAEEFAAIDGAGRFSSWDNTIYYYSSGVPGDSVREYWHFDENDNPVIWVAGTVVDGNEYVYSNSKITVSDTYWGRVKAAETAGTLETLFPSSELGEDIAKKHIEMVTSSSTKAEYEEKIAAFSAESTDNNSYKFEYGKVTVTIGGNVVFSADYVEFDNVIYVGNGQTLCYVDAENNRIYEKNETEETTAIHYYGVVSND